MKINKQELQNCLEIVKPGLASRELLAQTTSFSFVRNRVITYNDEISISCPVKGMEEMKGAVLAENLYKFLAKVPNGDMDLSIKGNEIVLTIERAKAGLNFFSEVTLPLEEELGNRGPWVRLPNDFNKAVAFVMSASGTSLNEPILTCVHISDKGYAEASDNLRIAKHNIMDDVPIEDMLIPARSMAEVVKLDPIRVSKGRGWVHFRNRTGVEISCRILNEDTYVDTSAYLQMKGTRVILPDKLDEVLARASIFAKRDNMLEEEVDITIENKTLIMEASSDSGWFEEKVNLSNYVGDPKKITIPPYLLREILKQTQACEISANKIKFEGDQWIYISQLKTKKKK